MEIKEYRKGRINRELGKALRTQIDEQSGRNVGKIFRVT